jgi:ABC-2 type transport system ATP-binding protein
MTTNSILTEADPQLPPSRSPALEVSGLTLSYGARHVLRGVDLRVERGEFVGILGHNGAGKTSLVEALQGLRRTDGGDARVLGLDPARDTAALRHRIGSQLQSAALPERMKVDEAVRLFSRITGDVVHWRALMQQWDLERLARSPFRALSGGEQQRLFLALALVGRPELVFLDELTQGLDPVARRATWELVGRLRHTGTTVILVSHYMDEVEALCDRVAILDGGRIARVGRVDEVIAGHEAPVRIRFSGNGPDLTRTLLAVTEVEAVSTRLRMGATAYDITGREAVAVRVAAALDRAGHLPTDFRVDPPTLEDVLIDIAHGRSAS